MNLCRHYFGFLVVSLLLSGCLAQGTLEEGRVPLSQDGEMVLFLQPLPPEAPGLKFTIAELSVLHHDGSRTPVPLLFYEIDAAALQGAQKKLASMVLPPGLYDGIVIRLARSPGPAAEGDTSLPVSDEPMEVGHQFDILPGKALALFFSIELPEENRRGTRFAPRFTLTPAAHGPINMNGYIANARTNTITVFNKKKLQVVDVIATDREPVDLVIDPDRTRAYAAVAGDNLVAVIDLFKRQVIEKLRLSLNDRPAALALTPDGRTMVAVNNGSNSISIIDALAMVEIDRISVGEGPTQVVITPSGLKAVVLNTRDSTVSVIDLPQKVLAVTIGLEGEPTHASTDRDGSRLYVVSHNSPNLAIIDLTSLKVTGKVFIGAQGACIATDPQTGLLYIGLEGPNEIVVVDPFALAPIDFFHLESRPAFLAIESQERHLFVTLPDQGELKRIEIISKRISTAIDVGKGANAVAFANER